MSYLPSHITDSAESLGVTIGPVRVLTGFQGSEKEVEQYINRFRELVGYEPVAIDGRIDGDDAERIVAIVMFYYDNVSTRDDAAAIRKKIVKQVGAQGALAWATKRAGVIIEALEKIADYIEEHGIRKKTSPWLVAGIGIGVTLGAVVLLRESGDA